MLQHPSHLKNYSYCSLKLHWKLYGKRSLNVSFFSLYFISKGLNVNLGDALLFLREYENAASLMCTRVTTAQWNFATNVTDANHQKMVKKYTYMFFQLIQVKEIKL